MTPQVFLILLAFNGQPEQVLTSYRTPADCQTAQENVMSGRWLGRGLPAECRADPGNLPWTTIHF